jgi:hypothetical protein
MLFAAVLHALPSAKTKKPLGAKTIKAYLGHVKSACTMVGAATDAFDDSRLALLLRAIKKRAPSSSTRRKLPITVDLLAAMIDLLNLSDHDALAFAAVLSVGVHGLFRSGEISTKSAGSKVPHRADISFERDGSGTATAMTIHLDASKTDPFRKGVDIRIVATRSSVCPVRLAEAAYDQATNKADQAPLFQTRNGRAVSYVHLTRAIRGLAARLGLDPKDFAGHSLRIGGATSLALAGVPAYEIRTLGRWASLSYQLYTRVGPGLATKASRLFASLAAPAGRKGFFGGMGLPQACKLTIDNVTSTAVAFSTSSQHR